jgi:hypothetical protein
MDADSEQEFVERFAPRDRDIVAAWLERRAARGEQGDEAPRLPKELALMTEEERRKFKEEGS